MQYNTSTIPSATTSNMNYSTQTGSTELCSKECNNLCHNSTNPRSKECFIFIFTCSVDIGEFNYIETFIAWVGWEVIVKVYSVWMSVRGGKKCKFIGWEVISKI